MARSVADQFVETLAAAGVKRIYGIVGDSLNGLTDAVRRQGKMEWLHFRHEEVAAMRDCDVLLMLGTDFPYRRGTSDRRNRRVRGKLRTGESAPHQRFV